MPSIDPGQAHLRQLVLAAAEAQGRAVDAERVLAWIAAAARGFQRRRATPLALPAAARRRRLRGLAAAFLALDDQLHGLQRDEQALRRAERPSLALWGSRAEFHAWRDRLEVLRAGVERLLAHAGSPARPGPRRDEATARLVLDIAWILAREGFRLSSYEDGLLASCVRQAGLEVGLEVPEDRELRRWLRPAVRFVKGGDPTSDTRNSPLTPAPRTSLSYRGEVH